MHSFLALNAFSILKRFLPVIPLDKNKILMFIKLDTKHEIFASACISTQDIPCKRYIVALKINMHY